MPKRQIHRSEIRLGKPLPCDVYDGKGVLLLRKGHPVANARQVEMLLQHAVLADEAGGDRAEAMPAWESPLALVLAVRRGLQALLAAPAAADFPVEAVRLAGMLSRACRQNPDVALASILMRREGPYAIRHAVNVAIACQVVGTALKADAAVLAATIVAALTMNIGMLELQEQLQAQVGPLNAEQHAAVRSHCERGVAILREHGVDDPAWLEAVRDHHERHDGSGYPAGKAGDAIALPARLLALADIYCARVSCRDCRLAMAPNVALRWLFLGEGAAVEEQMAAQFIKTLGIYPPGTGVRLRNGSVAVVTRRGSTGHMPMVASITTCDGLRMSMPIRRSGNEPAHTVSEVVDLDGLQLAVSMEALWGTDGVA